MLVANVLVKKRKEKHSEMKNHRTLQQRPRYRLKFVQVGLAVPLSTFHPTHRRTVRIAILPQVLPLDV